MTTRIISVLPQKAEARLATLIEASTTGSFTVNLVNGEVRGWEWRGLERE